MERKFSMGVVLCIFNKDFSKILLLKRNEEKRKRNKKDWGNVGGIVKLGETLINACTREAEEEIGVKINPQKIKLIEVKETPFFNEIFHAIHFVYTTTLKENQKIILNFNGVHESEEYKWFSVKNLPEKMLDSKKEIINWWKKAETQNRNI